jgi:drug/metabolite transporter (DMT)-like permease
MSQTLKSWILLLLLACIWGSSFILMKKGMFTIDEEPIFSAPQVASLRMLLASLALLPFAVKSVKKLQSMKDLAFFAVVGFCGNLIPAFLFTYAETGISSGFAGMMNSFTPVFALTIGWLVFSQPLTSRQIIGSIIATLGIVLLVWAGKGLDAKAGFTHVLAVVFATFLYGVSLNTIKHKLQHYPPVTITAMAFLIVFVPALTSFFFLDTISVMKTHPEAWSAFGYISVLALVGTALAVFIFNGIIRISSTLFASSVTYFIPIVAVIIGSYFGEKIAFGQILSVFVVLGGILLANRSVKISDK